MTERHCQHHKQLGGESLPYLQGGTMKFKGHGTIWNPDRNCVLVRFGKESIIDISDQYVIDKLRELGYAPENEFVDVEYEEIIDEVAQIDLSEMKKAELIDYIKKNIEDTPSGYERMKKSDLIDLANERGAK